MEKKQDKTLKDKAVKISGKSYVLVADRVVWFNENYGNGMIDCELLSPLEAPCVYMKAKVTPDVSMPARFFTGYSQAVVGQGMVNKTSALENCETSAVGRALAMMGIGVIESIASVDEITKAQVTGHISDKQKEMIKMQLNKLMTDQADYEKKIGKTIDELTITEASKCIETLIGRVKEQKPQEDEDINQIVK